MAQIFTKSTALGNKNCVVLDYRESFVYKFDVGDWNELYVGIEYNIGEGTNSVIGTAEAFGTIPDVTKVMFAGFKSDRKIFPYMDGEYFIGAGSQYYSNVNNLTATYSAATYAMPTYISPNREIKVSNSVQWGSLGTGISASAQSAYAAFMTMRIVVNNKNSSNQTFSFYKGTATATGGIISTKSWINNMYFSQLMTDFNAGGEVGLSNIDFTANGTPLPLPNSLYFYCPSFNSKMRIFRILIYKKS